MKPENLRKRGFRTKQMIGILSDNMPRLSPIQFISAKRMYPLEIEEILLKLLDINDVRVVPSDSIFEVLAAAVVRSTGSHIIEEEICKMDEGMFQIRYFLLPKKNFFNLN